MKQAPDTYGSFPGKINKSRLCILIPAILFLFPLPSFAQSATMPYLLPQTIFVGDHGRLVVPLGQVYTQIAPFVLEAPNKFFDMPDIVIQRIELEHRSGGPRLLIDFIPYVTGTLSFPPMDLGSMRAAIYNESILEEMPPEISGLEAQVASILSPSQTTLSEPASPMAVPGTTLLVYGTLALILLFLVFCIGGSIWGRRHFRDIWEHLRRRYLLRGMLRFMQRLQQECNNRKNTNYGFFLTRLSGEFREFLSLFTGVNCRPLTAAEFLDLPLHYDDSMLEDRFLLTPDYLCDLFRTWDTLRFSGRLIDRVDLFLAVTKAEKFLIALDKAERETLLSKAAKPDTPDRSPAHSEPAVREEPPVQGVPM